MVRYNKQTTSAVLPHLPKGMGMPQIKVSPSEDVLLPGQKTLPPAEWKEGDEQQLVPGIQQHQVVRKPSIARQGVPWTDRQSKVQVDNNENEPPPMFSATPRKSMAIRYPRESKSQKHVYRMDSGIDPVILLSNRLDSWRLAIKNLVSLFKKIVLVENKTSKGLVNASKEILLPFDKSNGQFLESGGIQDVWASIRDYTMQHGIMHHENSNYLQGAVIPSLRAIKADIKALILGIQKDKGLKSDAIFESRMQVDRLITRLDKVIESTQRAPHLADQNTDPFLVNLGVIHAIRNLCDHENRLHDNILHLQKETGLFEQKIIESTRHVLKNYQDFRTRNKLEDEGFIGKVNETFSHIQPTTEWNNFVHRNQFNLVMENSAYKTENQVEYPNQDSSFVRAIKIGPLQLKSGVMRGWTEGVYLLTPAGFLHGYKTPKHFQTSPLRPSYSVFVPHASIEADEDDFETFEIRTDKKSKMSLGGNHFTFRAPTIEENQSWFEQLVRLVDQFRVNPLLDTTENVFSNAPVHRDLPPLPTSVLPIEGNSTRAIEHQPGDNTQVPTNNQQQLHAVNEEEEEEEEGTTTPKQLTHSSQVLHGTSAEHDSLNDNDDNWQSTHEEDFDTREDHHINEEDDLATARQHLEQDNTDFSSQPNTSTFNHTNNTDTTYSLNTNDLHENSYSPVTNTTNYESTYSPMTTGGGDYQSKQATYSPVTTNNDVYQGNQATYSPATANNDLYSNKQAASPAL